MRAFAERLIDYVRRSWKHVFVDNGWFAIGLGVPAVCVVLAANAHLLLRLEPEQQWRLLGMLLELAGIGIVAVGLNETRRLFHRPSFWNAVGKFIRTWPGWAPTAKVVIGAGALSAASASMRARGSVRLPPDATPEQRIIVLEQQLENLSSSVFDNIHRIDDELAKQATSLTAERRSREEENQSTRQLIDSAVADGIALEGVGLVWLILGLIFSTGSQEAAAYITPLFR